MNYLETVLCVGEAGFRRNLYIYIYILTHRHIWEMANIHTIEVASESIIHRTSLKPSKYTLAHAHTPA